MTNLQSDSLRVLARSSVAAVGASFGRDIYRLAKRNMALALLAAAVLGLFYLPYRGGKLITSGGRFLTWPWTFQRALPGAIIVLVAYALLCVPALVLADSLGSPDKAVGGLNPGFITLWLVTLLTLVLTAAGAMRGFLSHRKNVHRAEIIALNDLFLTRHGFVAGTDGETSYVDGDGNPLRLVTTGRDKLTFLVTGRRRQRAYIDLDVDGRMTGYSGVITI